VAVHVQYRSGTESTALGAGADEQLRRVPVRHPSDRARQRLGERREELDGPDHARRNRQDGGVGHDLPAGRPNPHAAVAPHHALDRAREVNRGAELLRESRGEALVAAGEARALVFRLGCDVGARAGVDLGCEVRRGDLDPRPDRLPCAGIEVERVEEPRRGG
jgi:hypothetical protein